MKRDASTPLILWVCAAVCVHYVFAQGGEAVALVHFDHAHLVDLARGVRERVRQAEQTFDVIALENNPPTPREPEEIPPKLAKPAPTPTPEPPKPPPAPTPTPEPPKPPPAKEPRKEPAKPTIAITEAKAAPPEIKEVLADRRIAVRQHVRANQADNPNAQFVGDEANHVEKETVATQTSHDQDDARPTPGGNHPGPKGPQGDSERTRIGEQEEHPGEKGRAPGEKGTEFEVQREARAHATATPPPPPAPATMPAGGTATAGGDAHPASATAEKPASSPEVAGGAGPATKEAAPADAPTGWTFNPMSPGGATGSRTESGPGKGSSPTRPLANAPHTPWLGLGAKPAPGQININLTHEGVVAVVGQDHLRKLREADGERRRSEHRGSWTASNFERWRNAIENYVSTVRPGNQTALNTAAVPFATYLNGMHNRIHPIFADTFLSSLDALPRTHPLNNMKLLTRLEIVLTPDGHLVKMGVARTSGVTAFDIAALDSVQRSSPFGQAPSAIVSPDGNVYLHWEFHRDEIYACSTMGARPFMLAVPPSAPHPSPTQPPLPPSIPAPREKGGVPPADPTELRHGHRDAARSADTPT